MRAGVAIAVTGRPEIPTLCAPCRDARIEEGIVEREKQLDLIVELVLIALGVKLGRLHS